MEEKIFHKTNVQLKETVHDSRNTSSLHYDFVIVFYNISRD